MLHMLVIMRNLLSASCSDKEGQQQLQHQQMLGLGGASARPANLALMLRNFSWYTMAHDICTGAVCYAHQAAVLPAAAAAAAAAANQCVARQP